MNAFCHRRLARAALVASSLCAAMLGVSLAAEDAKGPRIAYLFPGPPACPTINNSASVAFQRRLQEAGYGNAEQTQYCYQTLADVPTRVRQILEAKPSIALIWGSASAARALRDASPTLPVVFVDVADPVKNGLAQSLSHPGGSTTGITNMGEELVAKRVQLLKESIPTLTRLAVIGNLTNPEQPYYWSVVQDAARVRRVEARIYAVETQAQLAPAFAAMKRDDMQAVLLLGDVWFYPHRAEIVALAAGHRLPMMYGNTAYADLGGLYTYGANLSGMGLKSIKYIDKILKGARPGDLPVERPEEFDFIVNLKTAREMGMTVPPTTLLRATQVVQ